MLDHFRALIIDDDRDLLKLIQRTLEFTAGWEVRAAPPGASGLPLARHRGPNVILVDVMMPEIDGYEVCRRLKADPATAGVPIVLLTARRDLDERRVKETGAAGVGGAGVGRRRGRPRLCFKSRSNRRTSRGGSASSANDDLRSPGRGQGGIRGRTGPADRDDPDGPGTARGRLPGR